MTIYIAARYNEKERNEKLPLLYASKVSHPYFLVSFVCAQIRERNLNSYITSV